MSEPEKRKFPNQEIRSMEMRAVDGKADTMTIGGYAIVFDSPATHQVGDCTFTETICRGALDKTNMKDVPLRYNHCDTYPIMARTRSKTLRLTVDDKGLAIEADLVDTQSNRDIYASIQAGNIDKMSFAFTIPEGGDTWGGDSQNQTRDIHIIDRLYDVSVVDVPFYDNTSISARALESLESETNKLESLQAERNEVEILKLKNKLKGFL